ncbi:MutS-like DNA mismatch repair ATPase [Thermococcus kodakarensis KOD1]|uniref:DNA-binding protein MutS2 n=1 Tax=Thermococcus kodakarensis (strain ATCC BAA-918 / JCM 12380 / KOD1) TaxID=69014 RepID=Q5JEZ3_THEKO|nr:DNA mismatch repair protein [Thermococcus kodakarensis]WCN28715.1 endonuclease MutS2 [Thermococcus kodakarensis]WCN31510.1 endonuclease MutS2 [Thermococcus kodakarensis]BAD84871.1 MutS-like DNA mismatch repair ATPase [Thermococcus kodakarensis KOD1]
MALKLNPEARAVYRDITSQIKSRLVLKESSDYLENFSPTNDRGEILKRQEYLREALRRVKPGLKELIKRVRFIRFTRDYLHDRVLIVDESEVETAIKLGLCDVTTNPEEAEGYPLVLSTIGYGIDVELLPSQVAPELYVLPLWENRETLKALEEIGKLTGEGSVAGEILEHLSPFGEVVEKEKLLGSLDELIAEKERELNERIEEKLEKFSLTLTGRDLVKFLNELREGNYEAIFSHFREIEGEILDMINEAESELSKVLGLHVELFSREELYPVRIPPEVVEGLRTELERELKVEVYMKAREIAEKVRPLLPKLREELSKIRELDFLQAVKAFTEGFTFPEIAESGIAFLNGRHLFIENPQPVSYVVGEKPEWFDVPGAENVRGENVVILTGANSGGKTSLLELITQVSILAHMGFPVPAERARVGVLDELFFFRRKRSVYGAGAFETALRSFVRSLRGKGNKLILIDEFEAITEPGAAVKIIGELLKVAHEKGFHVVIVSHLGEDLKKELPFARVDGIEAKGLDENLNLIVDRQPVFGRLGRSTPELIVERLARKARGAEKEIYERVLRKFRES